MFREKLSTKTALLLLAFLAAFFGYLRWQQYRQRMSIETEKNNLEAQIAGVEKKNQEMEAQIKYLSSLSSKEKVAREQLNLKKQGERIYSFTLEDRAQALVAGASTGNESNPVKWWRYFTE